MHDSACQVGMERTSCYLEPLDAGLWSPSVRPAVARAVYAEVALAAGNIWSPTLIERTIAALSGRPAHFRGRTNKFRKVLKKGVVPTRSTIAEIERALPTSDIKRWLKHPLFFLLDHRTTESPAFARSACHYAFDSLAGPIRDRLWRLDLDYAAWTGSAPRILDDKAMLEVLTSDERDTLDPLARLVMATAMARLASLEQNWRACEQATWLTFHDFGEAFARTPQLLVGWRWLLSLFQEIFWGPHNERCKLANQLNEGKRSLASAVDAARFTGTILPPEEIYDEGHLLEVGILSATSSSSASEPDR